MHAGVWAFERMYSMVQAEDTEGELKRCGDHRGYRGLGTLRCDRACQQMKIEVSAVQAPTGGRPHGQKRKTRYARCVLFDRTCRESFDETTEVVERCLYFRRQGGPFPGDPMR